MNNRTRDIITSTPTGSLVLAVHWSRPSQQPHGNDFHCWEINTHFGGGGRVGCAYLDEIDISLPGDCWCGQQQKWGTRVASLSIDADPLDVARMAKARYDKSGFGVPNAPLAIIVVEHPTIARAVTICDAPF